jgi:hemolysin III
MSKKYTKEEERINALSHAIGALMGIVVCVMFLVRGYRVDDSVVHLSLWLYLFGVVSSYLTSTIYHAMSSNLQVAKKTLRQFDHAAIYWHIAGSYSPITLIAMLAAGFNVWGWVIFAFVWLCAIVGTALSFRKMKAHSYLETACYVLMGLSILVAFKPFHDSVGTSIVLWVVAEGVSYIVGAVLYGFKKRRYMHSVFHGFVLLGDVCHMVAVYKVLEMFLVG